ncbi:cellulose binding domain-containing protein [Dactylosporangium vinaceum]|uniref:Cellulose binding domain-containing protein n=1 Tax=Dactylosporangium vinaceum TaxID=53362 RepID=A0ABV5LYD3_9ACTN|nr:cellulose binding domain-containing protein [Dactylosporangium vinaceum]UAB95863.1 cellulose binding domain-containing protein [Dactylosporangium vinaceum]
MWLLTRDRVLILTTALMTAVAATMTVLYINKSPQPMTPVASTTGPPKASPGASARATAAPGTVKADYAVRSKWKDGFNAEVTVTNLGSRPLMGWIVQLELPKDVDVTSTWGAKTEQAPGRLVLRSQAYNTYLEAGGAIRMGFEAKGPAQAPTSCSVNGTAC